jgi:tetratricopeptide (TPR) repeat protein
LAVILTPEETQKIDTKPTQDVEAYELFLRGRSCKKRRSKGDFELALSLFEEAVRLDPLFVDAHLEIADTFQEIYRLYERNALHLERSSHAAERAKALEGESARYYAAMSRITRYSDMEIALAFARRSVDVDPKYASGYDALGNAYYALGRKAEAVTAWQEYVRLLDGEISSQFTLITSLHELGDMERVAVAADNAIPLFERHLRLHPDDYHSRIQLANIFCYSGKTQQALLAADDLSKIDSHDGLGLYNLACLYLNCSATHRGMDLLRRSISKGFGNIDVFRRDPDLAPLRGSVEFEALIKELEDKLNA